MKITPLDIKKQEFGRKLRGYSRDEVDSYLEMVASEFENVLKKNLELEEKIRSLEEKLTSYTKLENVLQDTLVSTQRSAEEVKTAAEKRAKTITDEARISGEKILADARARLLDIQREMEDLKHQRDSFIVSFKSLLDTQQSMLEVIRKKSDNRIDISSLKMRTDLSDDDLERVVTQFERELAKNENRRLTDDEPPGIKNN